MGPVKKGDERVNTLICVIVYCRNSATGLADTLDSLGEQTLESWKAIIIGENSVSADLEAVCGSLVPEIADKCTFISLPATSNSFSLQLNDCVKHSTEEALTFCLPGDTLNSQFFEQSYGLLKNAHADLVVTPIRVADLKSPKKVSDTYEHTPRIDRFDPELQKFSFPSGKMISLDFIRRESLQFGDYSSAAPWHFFAMAALRAQSIFFSPTRACDRYRQNDTIDYKQLSFRAHDYLHATMAAYDDLLVRADSEIKTCLAKEERVAEAERLRGLSHLFPACIRKSRYVCLLNEFARHIWQLPDDDRLWLLDELSEGRANLSAHTLHDILSDSPEIAVLTSCDAHGLVRMPVVTFAFTPECKKGTFKKHLAYLVAQDYPLFEILVPSSLADQLGAYRKLPCVRIIETSHTKGLFKQSMLSLAKGSYLTFLEDELFWIGGTLSALVKRLNDDRIDFAAARPTEPIDAPKLKTLLPPFEKDRCTVSRRSRFNALDNSLNNKVIRVGVLQARHFTFTDNSAHDSTRLYAELAYRKYRDLLLLCQQKNSFFINRAYSSKLRYKLEYGFDRILHGGIQRRAAEWLESLCDTCREFLVDHRIIRNQMLFFSNRGNGDLTPNLRCVYDLLGGKKVIQTESLPHSRAHIKRIEREISRSRIIVTDDYLHELPRIKLKPEQSIVQLWHAAGAFKKFGLDCFGVSISKERAVHGSYKAVMVSSEGVRDIYANAFGISKDVVLALGTPRTDELLDAKRNQDIAEALYERLPIARDRKVVLYCPTFRQQMAQQVVWNTGIDWQALSDELGHDYLILVHKHPLEKFELVNGTYPNIREVDDIPTNDLLRICDCILTDYSSVIFDAALLDIPMAFYCPDIEEFERDFYLSFPDDLPGEMVSDPEMISNLIKHAIEKGPDERLSQFKEFYVGSCDGHSSQRIADYIKGL